MTVAPGDPSPEDGTPAPAPAAPLIVGVGASAGGLEALQELLGGVSPEAPLAFVVIQHLEPHHPSMLVELLARRSRLQVVEAAEGVRPEPGHVYAIAPGTLLRIAAGVLHVSPAAGPTRAAPIDVFLQSLAADQGARAVGVALSGAGHDGTAGLRAIRERGGLTLAQSPETARHESMPQSAIEAGLVDHVAPAAQLPALIVEHAAYVAGGGRDVAGDAGLGLEARLDEVCALLHQRTGHDFGRYKTGTLSRRIWRRMQLLRVGTVDGYLRLLQEAAAEPEALVKDLLIGVTQFFRDPQAFQALAHQVVPLLAQGAVRAAPIRVWVPGCASGEEAYSIAILLREHLGRVDGQRPVQIFATDLDAEQLAAARRGRYPEAIAEHVSAERLTRFFVHDGGTYEAGTDLRSMCVFSQHSLIRDPPFSHLDLVSCRNVLIYLNADLQRRLVRLFHYALRPGGFLLLGPSESVAGNEDLFEVIDKGSRLYRRRETVTRPGVEFPLVERGRLRPPGAPPASPAAREPAPHTARERLSAAFERALRDDYTLPAAVIDERGDALFVAGPISRYLQLPAGPVTTPNLLEAFRGTLGRELRTALRAVKTHHHKVVRQPITVDVDEAIRRVRLIVRPMTAVEPGARHYLVVVQEIDAGDSDGAGGVDPEPVTPAMEQLETELRATRAELRSTVEVLETTNEELQSSNEELISTNEELQSANEELQTSHEELQSLNEELETVNAELRQKVDELATANSDLQNLFAATEIATIFVDAALQVVKFTPAATALFHLIDGDLGRPLADLAPQFAGADLVADAREVLRRLAPIERQVRTATGVWFVLRVLPYLTADDLIQGVVITFVDVSRIKRAEDAARQQAQLVHLSHDAIFVRRLDGVIESWNRGAQELYGYTAAEAVGRTSHEILGTVFPQPLAAVKEELRRGGCWAGLLDQHTRDGSRVIVLSNMQLARGDDGVERVLEANRDVTEREATTRRLAYLASFPANNPNPIVEADFAGRVRYVNPTAARLFPTLEAEGAAHPWLAGWDAITRQLSEPAGQRSSSRVVPVGERFYHQQLVLAEEGVVRVYGRDVTERRQAEQERDRSVRQLRLALASARMGWWHYDPATKVAAYDERYAEIFGITGAQRDTDELLVLLHPDDLPRVRAAVERALDPADPKPYANEYRMIRPDGAMRWIEAHGVAAFEGEGADRHPTSFVGTVADITDRKQSEEALRESEERFRTLAINAQDTIVRFDRDGRYVYVNPFYARLLGRPAEEIVGRTAAELGRDTGEESLESRIGEVFATGRTLRFDHCSAEGRWYDVQFIPEWHDAQVHTVLAISRDVSERRLATAALRESEERFRLMADSSPMIIWVTDQDGGVRFVNRTYREFFGVSLAEVEGGNWQPLIHPDDAPTYVTAFLEAVREHRPFQAQVRVRRADGEWRWVASQGEPRFSASGEYLGHVGVSPDVTGLKEAEAARRDAMQRLESLLGNSPLAVVEWSLPDYRIVRWSDEAERVFGWRAAEVLGKRIDEMAWVYEDDWPMVEQAMAAMLSGASPRNVNKNRNRRKDGAVIHCEWYNSTVTDAAGQVTAVLSLVLDVTELRRAEEALREANARLVEADQRKNEFLAVLSHELRNPLTPVRNSLYVLEHAAPGSPPAREALEVITRQTGQLVRLVDDLLDVTRVSRNKIQLQRRHLDLNALVGRVVADHRSLFAEHGIQVETTLTPTALPVDGDDARLAQALGNLLQNAAKFTPEGGRVSVVTALTPSGRAALHVRDTGVGVEPALLQRLFQPFMQADSTLDRSKGGLGLGLALVKGVVELHGGEVSAHSDGPGHGAEFVIELPLDRGEAPGPQPAPPVGPRRSRRVLVIEDNVDAAESLRAALEFGAHVVEVAHDGPSGLATARTFGPEVVLCDIGLPGMDGFAVARAFRADPALQGIVLIALSGYALPEDLERAAAAGFQLHLAKPASLRQLQQLLAELPA